jgi:hypothetical protein
VQREALKSTLAGIVATAVLAGLILGGSRRFQNFDAALVGYTFAALFSVFGITYRYTMWLQRPPTRLYWRRGWELFLDPRRLGRNLTTVTTRFVLAFMLNQYIWRRGAGRGLAHMLIMWGCVIAALITFPLVFGWVHFETPPDDVDTYIAYVFGLPTLSFPADSYFAKIMFHGLVWSSYLVIAGVMLAMRRRMRDHGAAALQKFGEDILPLLLLFAISVTGLALWVSYSWMEGYAFSFLQIIHAITVIFTLIWLPFGKFFHIFQRPAQLGVSLYKEAGRGGEQAKCKRCGEGFASRMHVEDLIEVQRELGYRYETEDAGVAHYQWVCPRCRRLLLGISQGALWRGRGSSGDSFDTSAAS